LSRLVLGDVADQDIGIEADRPFPAPAAIASSISSRLIGTAGRGITPFKERIERVARTIAKFSRPA
jgi:hypothetical protein